VVRVPGEDEMEERAARDRSCPAGCALLNSRGVYLRDYDETATDSSGWQPAIEQTRDLIILVDLNARFSFSFSLPFCGLSAVSHSLAGIADSIPMPPSLWVYRSIESRIGARIGAHLLRDTRAAIPLRGRARFRSRVGRKADPPLGDGWNEILRVFPREEHRDGAKRARHHAA